MNKQLNTWKYLRGRLFWAVFSLWVVSFLSFWLAELAPGSAAEALLGSAGLAGDEAVNQLQREWGLNRSWAIRYWDWLLSFFAGNWGYSHISEQHLKQYLLGALGVSVKLGILALGWMAFLGLGSGIWSVLQRGKIMDKILGVLGLLGLSLPSFWLGLLSLVITFKWFGVLPIYTTEIGSHWQRALIWGLPSLIVGLRGAALLQRITRTTLLEAIEQDYWRTALAKGLHPKRAIRVHALRHVLPPLVTVMGVEAAFMLGGLVVTETVFNIPGLGMTLVHAVRWRDWETVRTMLLLFTLLTFAINLLVDVVNIFVNPSLRETHSY